MTEAKEKVNDVEKKAADKEAEVVKQSLQISHLERKIEDSLSPANQLQEENKKLQDLISQLTKNEANTARINA